MKSREEVRAIAGVGLEDDRYANESGAFSKGKAAKIRHVTLVSLEAIAEANAANNETQFSPEETRRNLVTTGVDLNQLVDQEFQVGSVRMRGTELCKPCARPSNLSGKPGFKDSFENKGGLRAEILNDGDIKKGDTIQVFSKDS